ncbi:MAG: T5SS/PEP-CTERM-associated repeat protein, partial [Verrucomicrobiales bacterium]
FRTRSNNQVANVITDISAEIASGGWLQAVGTIDFALNTVELFVNGISVGTGTATGNINDWDGGDGDGLGGQGGDNLGGFGGGFGYDGGTYGALNGQIAIFRIYQDVTAAAAAGALLTPVEVLQNYQADLPALAHFIGGAGNRWVDDANWFSGQAPTNSADVFIGSNLTAIVDTNIAALAGNVTLGHTNGIANGIGTLQVDAGGLQVDHNLNVGSDERDGRLTINEGMVRVGNDLNYGLTGNSGGTVTIFSGTLTVEGNIRERATSVSSAQLYINGGSLVVGGDSIVVQSFRTGDLDGSNGTFTLSGGKRLDNTGTFFVGRRGAGTFTIEDGSVHLNTGGNDVRLGAEAAASTGVLNLDHPNARLEVNSANGIEIGLVGSGTLNLFDGTVDTSLTQFGRSNGLGGIVNIQGGEYIARGNITTGAAAQDADFNLSGGVLDLSASAAAYNILNLTMQGDATMRYQARATGFTPLNVISNGTFTAGTIDVLDPPLSGASTANTATWVASTDTWDLDGTKWLNNAGSPGIPAVASGVIFTGAVFDVMTTTAGTFSGVNTLAASPDWELVTPDPLTVAVRRTGPPLDGGPAVARIDNPLSAVARNSDLHIFNGLGSDATRLDVIDGSLILAPGSELILGGSVAGDYNHNGGSTVMETLRYGTSLAGFGGTVNLRGGSLHVTGDIIEHAINVNAAQMYIDGGALIADGDITVQSFRTGNGVGSTGSYVQTNGQVIVNTGTFVVGIAGTGTHHLDDGTIVVKNNLIIGDTNTGKGTLNIGRPGTTPHLSVGSDNLGNANSAFDIGDQGPGFVNLTNGTVVTDSDLIFGRTSTAGGGTLHVAGGRFTALRDVEVGVATNAAIHLEGGELELLADTNLREILDYTQSNAVLRIGANNVSGDSTPLTILDEGVFGPGALIDLTGAQTGLASITTNAVSWVGGDGVWNTDTNNWLNLAGNAYLPSNGQNFIPTGMVYAALTGANLVGTNLVQSANPDLELVVSGNDTLSLKVIGEGLGGQPVAAILASANTVTRDTGLRISPEFRADAAKLTVSNGALNVDGDLSLGGTQYGIVDQLGGDVTLAGDLLFGGTFSGTRGGTYNLNQGSLTVGAITELEIAIDSAQLHWNGGSLNVRDSIELQRFSVAEIMATNTAVVTVPVYTSGGFTVGSFTNAVGHLTLRGADLVHQPSVVILGQTSNAKGTLVVEDGSMIIRTGLDVGGDNQGDAGTEGVMIVGTDAGPGPYISSTGGNVEIGRAGKGTLTMKSGTFDQLSSNLVLGQYTGSTGTFNIEGGTYRMSALTDFNMNAATGVVNQTGGTVEVGRSLNLGSNAASLYTYHLDGGLLTIGANLDFRTNGDDAFNLNGGSLVFTNGAGTIFADRTGVHTFNFTDGLLKNCERFQGSLEQQGGVLDIGASAGLMTITGDYTGSAAGTLKVELDWDPAAGPAQPGVDYDQLVVNGNTDLTDLNLDVSVLNPAITNAPVGTVFTIVDGANPITGFVSGPSFIDVGGTPFFVNHGSDLQLILFSNDLQKDADLDGVPDLQELAFGTDASDGGTGPEALPHIVRVDGTTVRVLYRQVTNPLIPLSYGVTATTDLSTPAPWPLVGVGTPSSPQPNGLPAGVTQMEADFSVDPDLTRYFRVRVDLN